MEEVVATRTWCVCLGCAHGCCVVRPDRKRGLTERKRCFKAEGIGFGVDNPAVC